MNAQTVDAFEIVGVGRLAFTQNLDVAGFGQLPGGQADAFGQGLPFFGVYFHGNVFGPDLAFWPGSGA